MKLEDFQSSFKVIHSDYRNAVALAEGLWIEVTEQRMQDEAERHARVSIVELDPNDANKVIKRDSVCSVAYERLSLFRPETGYWSLVNWSAWGSTKLDETRRFAEAILVAIELGKLFATGFTFLAPLPESKPAG